MHTNDSERRFSAVQRLQSIRDRYQPGSFKFDKADHAIDLALSPGRVANDFLVVNTLRDSGRILKRQAEQGPQCVFLDAPVTVDGDGDDGEETTLHDLLPGRVPTPAEECGDKDFVETLLAQLGDESPAARKALEAMLDGETAEDFIRRTGFSESYYKKLRMLVRSRAQKLN